MLRKFFYLAALEILVLFVVTVAFSQTVSPVIAECGAKKCSGSFSIRNEGVKPLVVTVEAKSTTLDTSGRSVFTPLDSSVVLSLSETSARVGPKASNEFSYVLTCSAHCIVTFISSMTVGRTVDGLQVRVTVPHVVYAGCTKAKNCRAEIRKAAGLK